jgi:hypothetical protein
MTASSPQSDPVQNPTPQPEGPSRTSDSWHEDTQGDQIAWQGSSSTRRRVVTCGVLVVLLILAAVAYFANTLRVSKDLEVSAQVTPSIQVGDDFRLLLHLENMGSQDISVQDIDLSPSSSDVDSILTGASVTSIDPTMTSTDLPQRMRAYHFNQVVKSGETKTITFYLRAVEPGEFHTDLDIYLSNARSALWDMVISIAP